MNEIKVNKMKRERGSDWDQEDISYFEIVRGKDAK